MAEIIAFGLTVDEYLSLATKALDEGSLERSVGYLQKALELDEKSVESKVRLASAYSELGNYPISNAVLFQALGGEPDDDQMDRIFYLLATNFLQLGQGDVVEYYMRYFDENYVIGKDDKDEDGSFRVAYPRGEDYYAGLLEKAYDLVRNKQLDQAVEVLKNVDRRSASGDAADHLTLVSLMMKNDVGKAIETAKQMLDEHDSLSVKCTLATAYLMEDKIKEACEIVDKILETDYTKLEDMLMLLPLVVSLNMHPYVVLYTKRILGKIKLQPNTMLWLSQGLWNIAQRKEAVKVMNRVRNIYGDYSPADYYLAVYEHQPENVEYSMTLPYQERLERFNRLEELLTSPVQELERLFADDGEFNALIEWALHDDNEKAQYEIVASLDRLNNDDVRDLFRRMLLLPNLSFDVCSRIVVSLLGNKSTLNFKMVAQDRYKEVYIETPQAYNHLPKVFDNAVCYAMCDIIYTDEDPVTFLTRLKNLVDGIVRYAPRFDRLNWTYPKTERVGRLKSTNTLVGVLLARVYEDDVDDPRADSISRYGLNPRAFDKYNRILFGLDENRPLDMSGEENDEN